MDKTRIFKARIRLGILLVAAAIFAQATIFRVGGDYQGQDQGQGQSQGQGQDLDFNMEDYLAEIEAEYAFALNGYLQNDIPVQQLIGLSDAIFLSPPEDLPPLPRPAPRTQLLLPSDEYLQQLTNFDYLTSRIFLVDRYTILFPSDVDVREFAAMDFSIDTATNGPQVLIFHTHSMEDFVDSDPDDKMTGVVGVGRYLAEVLAEVHGIEVIHYYTTRFDMVDGRSDRGPSYERMEPVIKQILADNPSIQMVIDLHRDGIDESLGPLVTYIDGRRTAQIMFVNGLSRRYRNGVVTDLTWLYNPNQRENLAFTFHLQLAANQLYPGLARRAYLAQFRYSLHMMPRSMLVEVGAQNNTLQEALNAVYPLADIIAAVVGG